MKKTIIRSLIIIIILVATIFAINFFVTKKYQTNYSDISKYDGKFFTVKSDDGKIDGTIEIKKQSCGGEFTRECYGAYFDISIKDELTLNNTVGRLNNIVWDGSITKEKDSYAMKSVLVPIQDFFPQELSLTGSLDVYDNAFAQRTKVRSYNVKIQFAN